MKHNRLLIGGGILNQYRSELFGIAATLILIGHSQNFMTSIFPESIISIIGYGGIGVTMFAFLSGVGLWQSYDKSSDLKRYYTRRVQRVLLPYLAISVLFNLIIDVVMLRDALRFITDVTCVSFWTNGRGAWYVAWVIPIYIVYPFYAKVTHKKSWISLVLVGLIIILIATLGMPSRFESAAGATIAFLIGDFAGLLVKENRSKMIYIMLIGILIAPLYMLRIISGQAVYVCFFALVGIALCALFSLIVAYLPESLNNGLKAIGKASLECYLFNIYLSSVARLLLGDRIQSVYGIVVYGIVLIVGVVLSCCAARIEGRLRREHRR